MKRKFGYLIAVGFALAMAGCATTTSGPTIPSQLLTKLAGSPVLENDPGVLTLYAENLCNVGAAQEYRLSLEACEGEFASFGGGALIPANAITAIDLACNVMGYTNASNQIVVPTTINVGPLTTTGPCVPSSTVSVASLPKLKG